MEPRRLLHAEAIPCRTRSFPRRSDAAAVGVPFGARLLLACVVRRRRRRNRRPPATVLHLSQTAERKVVRDLLRVELRVEQTGADPLALQSAINRRMAAALDRAHQVQGVAVETGAYAVNEEQPQTPRRAGAPASR